MKITFTDNTPVYDDTKHLGVTYIDYSTLTWEQMLKWLDFFYKQTRAAELKQTRVSAYVTNRNKD